MAPKISRERLERVSRIYASTRDAALAVGMAPGTLLRMWKRHGIPSPAQRKQKRRESLREVKKPDTSTVSPCCGKESLPVYTGNEHTEYRCPCGQRWRQ